MRINPVIAALLTLLGAPRAFAWGAVGHETVAQIAETILKTRDEARPAGKKTVDQILAILNAGDCAKENVTSATFGDVDFGGPKASLFVQSATWLDDARSAFSDPPKPGQAARTPADTVFLGSAAWHFVDIPLEAQRADFDTGTVCPNRACAPNKIEDFMGRLIALRNVDTTAPDTDRDTALDKCRALKTIIHLVGDLHQPMHAVDFHNDRGGNDRLVDFFGESNTLAAGAAATATRANLHSIWDSNILKDMMKRDGVADVQAFSAVLVQELLTGSKGAADEKMPFTPLTPFKMLTMTVWDWAWESHQGAVGAYQNEAGDQRGDSLPPLPAPVPGQRAQPAQPFAVKTGYLHAADAVVREQLKKGGLRLADLLDKPLAQ